MEHAFAAKKKKKIILSSSFYLNNDVVYLAKQLLGKYLFTSIAGMITGGEIVETESYKGPEDRACHAFNNRKTKRTEVMFMAGGISYVYLCYGIHSLFNIVTAKAGIPHAVLIRAIKPVEGISTMLTRRNCSALNYSLTNGPGSLTKALGITTMHTGLSLLKAETIWIEDRGISYFPKEIIASPRVGVSYAGKDALLPWRFRIKDNPWTSTAK